MPETAGAGICSEKQVLVDRLKVKGHGYRFAHSPVGENGAPCVEHKTAEVGRGHRSKLAFDNAAVCHRFEIIIALSFGWITFGIDINDAFLECLEQRVLLAEIFDGETRAAINQGSHAE